MTTTIEKVKHPARIGDLVVVESEEHSYAISQPSTTQIRYDVAEVAGCFRDGRIKQVRRLDWRDATSQSLEGWIGLKRCWLIEAVKVDKAAAVEAIRAHRWPTAPDSQMIMPWSDLVELTKLLAGFRMAKTGWQVA